MRRPLIFAILAGMAAVLAAIIVFSALKRREAEVQKAMASTVDIVVAARDMRLGERIDANAIKLARWQRDSVPAGAFTDPQAVISSFVRSEIVASEPIVAAKLFMGEKTAGVMPLLIPAGMRAMAVQVDEVATSQASCSRMRTSTCWCRSRASGRDQPSFSKMVLQDIEVLAVAQEIEKKTDETEEVKVVTLLVTPEQCGETRARQPRGQLRLAMRNYTDSKIITTSGAEMSRSEKLRPAGHPHLRPAAVAPAGRPRAPVRTLNVQIMRDGRSAESVIIHQIRARRSQHELDTRAAAPAAVPVMPGPTAGGVPLLPRGLPPRSWRRRCWRRLSDRTRLIIPHRHPTTRPCPCRIRHATGIRAHTQDDCDSVTKRNQKGAAMQSKTLFRARFGLWTVAIASAWAIAIAGARASFADGDKPIAQVPLTITAGETYTVDNLAPGSVPAIKVIENPHALVIHSEMPGKLILLGAERGRWIVVVTRANGHQAAYDVIVNSVAAPGDPLKPGESPSATIEGLAGSRAAQSSSSAPSMGLAAAPPVSAPAGRDRSDRKYERRYRAGAGSEFADLRLCASSYSGGNFAGRRDSGR